MTRLLPRFGRRIAWRPRWLIAVGVVVVALFVVPVALAGARIYWYQTNIPSHTSESDFIYHNHTYNQMYWGPGATWPGYLYMLDYQDGKVHYFHSFNGNAAYSDAGTYFNTPLCENNDGTQHFVDHCNTQW